MKIINSKNIGTVVRTRRKQLKVTQTELAMTCGTGLRFIVDLEKGKPTCHIGKTLQVLQALGLSTEIGQIGGNETGGKKP